MVVTVLLSISAHPISNMVKERCLSEAELFSDFFVKHIDHVVPVLSFGVLGFSLNGVFAFLRKKALLAIFCDKT
jgi:hypothetical protein